MTVNVLAVIEPKDANTLVRKLNQIAPLENLRHVKRVLKKCIDGGKPRAISAYLSTFITQVCKYAATSKEEWDEQCKLWPTSYHPPTYNISGITGFIEKRSPSPLLMSHTINLATSVGQCQCCCYCRLFQFKQSLPRRCSGIKLAEAKISEVVGTKYESAFEELFHLRKKDWHMVMHSLDL
ncbi:hypothetical protein HAX54_034572 [Datura stramonium]|uniref:Uncharacterized protein n=1 Tax=Datura stramonium TaxID=4076 RepID=A0ABS8SEB3_DATST|nr:hypothetical protein [Datura stramonium]